MIYKMTNEVFDILETERLDYLSWFLKDHKASKINVIIDGEYCFKNPKVYMLGGAKNTIKKAVELQTTGGCGMMSSIEASEFARGLINITSSKLMYLGLARVGAFHIRKTVTLGELKYRLNSIAPDTLMLSMGRNGMLLEKVQGKQHKIDKVSIKII